MKGGDGGGGEFQDRILTTSLILQFTLKSKDASLSSQSSNICLAFKFQNIL